MEGGRERSQGGSEAGNMGDRKKRRQLSQPNTYTCKNTHIQKHKHTNLYTQIHIHAHAVFSSSDL